ncbi:MAG TPA: response regulator [Caulobacteraceae bacterium]|jgi:DNA-binding response OmpR family regulator|nr:response regulator [Caulobacteraceae bacterium]
MALYADNKAHFNLKYATILLADSGSMDMDIMVSMMMGFGAKTLHKQETIAGAKNLINKTILDLVVVGATLGDGDGCDLVRWIRREVAEPNRFVPVLMIVGHTAISRISKARDCGASLILAKPLTPMVLIERIIWVAREGRSFVDCESYAGPDRRFKFTGPPQGANGRRKDDLSGHVSTVARAANMSQEQIDAMMAPRKVSL